MKPPATWPRLLFGMALGALVPTAFLVSAARAPQLASTLVGRPECPHDWPFKSGQMPEAGSTLNVPEFNDCQRFIVETDTGLVYDSLYAIFAAETLAAIQRIAWNVGPSQPLGHLRSYIDTGTAVVVATIYAEGTYDQLGIRPPMNCLFVFRNVEDELAAKMVPRASIDSGCVGIDYRTADGTDLAVHRQVGRFAGRDFPPVTRWDWDDSTKTQYIGFGCAVAWCHVARPQNLRLERMPPGLDRTRLIKGWYDQQWLAWFVNGRAFPSTIWGTIYADPRLDGRKLPQFENMWTPVARVVLEGSDPIVLGQYKERFNYDPVTGADSFNIISLCKGHRNVGLPAGACAMPVPGQLLAPGEPERWTDSVEARLAKCVTEGDWWARVEGAAGGPPRYYCLTRRGADNAFLDQFRKIPGTARWRWMAIDEGTWTACGAGCCEKLGQ